MYTQKVEVSPVGGSSWTNITNYLAPKGLVWSRIDVDLTGTATQAGVVPTVRLREKKGLQLNFRGLLDTELSTIMTAFKPKFVRIRVYSPETGTQEVTTYKTNGFSVKYQVQRTANSAWEGFSITLEEY